MKKIMIGVMVMIIMLLTGCSADNNEYPLSDDPNCRESVFYRSKSFLFGTGKLGDEDVALKYLYESEEVAEVYGDSFQMPGEKGKIVCHKSSGHTFFFPGIFKGEAIYEFVFEDQTSYTITVSKDYFGRWKVDNAEWTEYDSEDRGRSDISQDEYPLFADPYCRENVFRRSKSFLFGTGKLDDEDVALKYLYESEEVAEVYGDSFQLTGEDVICHKSEGQTFFLSGIFKGEAVYEFVFEDQSYQITLSKDYLSKWKIDNAEWTEHSCDGT